jgi:hypothetical protein
MHHFEQLRHAADRFTPQEMGQRRAHAARLPQPKGRWFKSSPATSKLQGVSGRRR